LADKTRELLFDALRRAAADPAGVLLHGNRKTPGLFPTTAAARQTALRSKEEGYLRVVADEPNGKGMHEICALTEKGLAYLLEQTSPKQVLEDLVSALQTRQHHVAELVATARQWESGLVALAATVTRVLHEIGKPGALPLRSAAAAQPVCGNGSEAWTAELAAYLRKRQSAEIAGDCPLPELYRHLQAAGPAVSIGRFHDELRRLHDSQQVRLHPWTGPLYEIPEPAYALLVGHVVAYYASLR
jgi:hypothetical protein